MEKDKLIEVVNNFNKVYFGKEKFEVVVLNSVEVLQEKENNRFYSVLKIKSLDESGEPCGEIEELWFDDENPKDALSRISCKDEQVKTGDNLVVLRNEEDILSVLSADYFIICRDKYLKKLERE